MKIGLTARIEFSLPITQDQIAILTKLAKHHYDAKCKAAPFLARWASTIEIMKTYEPDPDHHTVDATNDQIQTCLKLMEMATALLEPEQITVCRALSRDLSGALHLSNECYSNWQATYGAAA